MILNIRVFSVVLSFIGLFMTSCRGQKTPDPPILPIQNMVTQTSYGPQAPNQFFSDKRAIREPVKNTVAEGEAHLNIPYHTGQEKGSTVENPVWVKKFPLKLNEILLQEGQKNFNIYCSPCHGLSGHNDGLVTKRSIGTIRPAEIHSDQIRQLPIGKIYHAVTYGVNNWNMPGFSAQLTDEERWAVVAYVRALQLSEQASANDVPKDLRSRKGVQK